GEQKRAKNACRSSAGGLGDGIQTRRSAARRRGRRRGVSGRDRTRTRPSRSLAQLPRRAPSRLPARGALALTHPRWARAGPRHQEGRHVTDESEPRRPRGRQPRAGVVATRRVELTLTPDEHALYTSALRPGETLAGVLREQLERWAKRRA